MSKPLNEMRSHSSILPVPKRGIDRFTITPPDGDAFIGSRITMHESRPGSGAQILAKPANGSLGKQEISVEWWHQGATNLRYQLEGFTALPQISIESPTPGAQMTGFVPSKHGFHFINYFPDYPDISLPTPFGKINIGNAKNGLCGGMVFAALDFYHSSMPIPDTTIPPTGDMLFEYIVKRLFESFNLPIGIASYIELMNSYLPDGENEASVHGVAPHGRAWRTIRVEWPIIKTLLDAGQPCPLGLIRVKSTDFRKLGHNHQVLAYGYEIVDDTLSLSIYDPNYLNNDEIKISINLSNPEQATAMTYSTGEPLYAFFHVNYKFQMPIAANISNSRILIFEQPNFTGRMKNIALGSPNLALIEDGIFNDQISSFIIVNGNWMLYKNSGFNSPYLRNGQPLVLGPGHYPLLEPLGIQDNDISSLKSVDIPVNQ